MKRSHRSAHPWLWIITGAAALVVLVAAVRTRTDPTPDLRSPGTLGATGGEGAGP